MVSVKTFSRSVQIFFSVPLYKKTKEITKFPLIAHLVHFFLEFSWKSPCNFDPQARAISIKVYSKSYSAINSSAYSLSYKLTDLAFEEINSFD